MRPGSLFDFLGGELVDIVEYATDHHKKTGRPPRLAVNADSWWYANMTTTAVKEIRGRTGQHVNPIERSILFYTLGILQLGIQLHFVFDGPKCLINGRKPYPGHDPPSLLFRDILTQIAVPWHEAPAEAEAECAKMEMENMVDGVWSENGDAMAFGCQTLIRFHWQIVSSTERAEDKRKSKTEFKIYKLDDIATRHPSMNREEFILFAVLNSRPRDLEELYDLEPQDVLDAADLGLGRSLCAAAGSVEDLKKWASMDLAVYMMDTGKHLEIPPDFPTREHVQNYLVPVTSSTERLLNIPQPKDPFVNEQNLFSFLANTVQLTKTQWVKYVIPIRIVRLLVATKEGEEIQHRYLKIDWKEKKQTPGARAPQIAKAKFLVCRATSLDLLDIYSARDIHEKKEKIDTLPWIIRKAPINDQRSMTSFLTPNSGRKGKAVAPSSPRHSSQRPERDAPLLTPSSSPTSNSNGEGSSTRVDRQRRENTPPSPTHAPKRRKLPWPKVVRVTKNIRRAPKKSTTSGETSASAAVVEKEIASFPRINRKRPRSPSESSSSSDFFEEMGNKRLKRTREQPPPTPQRQTTKSVATNSSLIVIDCDLEENHPRTPLTQIRGEAEVIDITSDSDDEYGSFPSIGILALTQREGNTTGKSASVQV